MAVQIRDELIGAIQVLDHIEFDDSAISAAMECIGSNLSDLKSHKPPNEASRQALRDLETGEGVRVFGTFAEITTDDID